MQTFTILGDDAPHRNLQSIHTKYESLHTFKGAIRGFRYCDLTSRSQLFSFIVNRKSLLFDMSLANISQTQPSSSRRCSTMQPSQFFSRP